MMQLPTPGAYEPADEDDPPLEGGLSGIHLSIFDFIDECANAVGAWGPEDNIRVKRPRRRG